MGCMSAKFHDNSASMEILYLAQKCNFMVALEEKSGILETVNVCRTFHGNPFQSGLDKHKDPSQQRKDESFCLPSVPPDHL